MLDIKYIRENPDKVKKACELKYKKVDVDALLLADKEQADLKRELDELNRQKNEVAKTRDAEKGKEVKEKIKVAQEKFDNANKIFTDLMEKLPSVPSDDTPIGKDDSENVVLRTWGEKPTFDFEPKEHYVLGKDLGVIDSERAGEIVGSRFTYLKGDLARIQFAIINHVMNTLSDRKK